MLHRPNTWIAALRPPLAALLAAVLLLASLAPVLPSPEDGQAGMVRIAGVSVPLCLGQHDKGSSPRAPCHDGLCCLALDLPAMPPTPGAVRTVWQAAPALPVPARLALPPTRRTAQPRAPPFLIG